MVRPIENSDSANFFQARWDASFGRLEGTASKKAGQAAWNVLSVLIPVIALARYGAYKISQKVAHMVLLPSMNKTAEEVAEAKKAFFDWVEEEGEGLPFTVESHRVATPDKAQLNALFLRHREADAETPTLIYFNPNAAISYEILSEDPFHECFSRDHVCNFAVFDYRNTGDSRGTFRSFDDLVVDGASIVQWVREKIGTPSDKIKFYGWSMGGAVATEVKALNPSLTSGDYANERSFSSIADMIDTRGAEFVPIKLFGCIEWDPRNCVKALSRWLGVSIDVVPAFKRLEGRKLVIYHPEDIVIPYSASLERRVRDLPHEAIRLDLPLRHRLNHHVAPLQIYRDGATQNPALQQIGDFLFGPRQASAQVS